jgi:hypothetical protein
MDIPVLIAAVLLASGLIGGLIAVVVVAKRQEARKKVTPSLHRGEFQSQKDRVFKKGSTDHNDAPTSPS